MKSSKYNTSTSNGPESTKDNDQPVIHNPQHTSLAGYIKDHKLPASAANDPHQLALAKFLCEHMRQRANAQLESTED